MAQERVRESEASCGGVPSAGLAVPQPLPGPCSAPQSLTSAWLLSLLPLLCCLWRTILWLSPLPSEKWVAVVICKTGAGIQIPGGFLGCGWRRECKSGFLAHHDVLDMSCLSVTQFPSDDLSSSLRVLPMGHRECTLGTWGWHDGIR